MNYHNIRTNDMLNGQGIRVVLFVSGCEHKCLGCQNIETWDSKSGILFDKKALDEIYDELRKDYISGLTLSGGDPLYEKNINDILDLVCKIKQDFPNKNIWIYTGFTFHQLKNDNSELGQIRKQILRKCDVLVDGKFMIEFESLQYPWAGSTNQNVINLRKEIF